VTLAYWLTLLVALIGGVPGAIAIWKSICRTSIKIAFDEEQSFICIVDSDNKIIHGKYCFGFYMLYLVGKGELPTTPKEVKFFIKKKRKWIDGNQVRIETSKIQGRDNCVTLDNGRKKIVLMNWFNLQPNNSELLHYGAPIIGSIVFYFDLSLAEIKTCKYMKFVVEDYLGKIYKHKAKIKEKYFNLAEAGFKIIDKNNGSEPVNVTSQT
jgi:hypothetical protein